MVTIGAAEATILRRIRARRLTSASVWACCVRLKGSDALGNDRGRTMLNRDRRLSLSDNLRMALTTFLPVASSESTSIFTFASNPANAATAVAAELDAAAAAAEEDAS